MSGKEYKEHRHSFTFNPDDNGGEAVCLTTKFFDNGDSGGQGIYMEQELTLHSYCNMASFQLGSAVFTPAKLRELANQLEQAENMCRIKEIAGEVAHRCR